MKNGRPLLLLFFLVLITYCESNAQVHTKRLTNPQSLRQLGIRGDKQTIPTLRFDAIDPAPLLAQDALDAKNGMPFRFGVARPAPVDVLAEAAQSVQDGFRVYEYRIDAAGALSINLIFDQLQLRAGARMYLYNGDRTMVIGPITDRQNTTRGDYWTDLLEGSNLTIEVQEPLNGAGGSIVHLKSVTHGYRDVLKAFGDAGTCHPNMACYPEYQFQGDGVALILLSSGTRLCTGSMVNTMRQSFRSFFQSAFHCIDMNYNKVADPEEIAEAENWLIRFNYQSPSCTPTQEDLDVVTLSGSTYRSSLAETDFLLIELTQQVPVDVNTTYNGWNRTDALTSNNFAIHHPRGDVKKISFADANTERSDYGGGSGGTHVIAFWGDRGVTDPGSSGSPLFDSNRRIIGQLQGGPSFCAATGEFRRDYFGRVFRSWTGGGTNSTRLSNWLDPDNSPALTTDGVKPFVSGPAALTNTGTFALNTRQSSIVSWAVQNGAGMVTPTSGIGNAANLTVLGTTASLTITFTINDGQSYLIRFEKVFSTERVGSGGNGLALLPPAYNCATGEITFNTTGGDGSPIVYSAVGVQRDNDQSRTGTVESGLRADPKPLFISAVQSGVTVSQTFDLGAFCASPGNSTATSPPSVTSSVPVSGTGLTLLPPTYNCATGEITFNSSGGDGSLVTYVAVGVQRAALTSNTGRVEAGLRADPKPLTIQAVQSGITVTQTFDFGAYCPSALPTSTTSTDTSTSPLTLLTPTYNCATGDIAFNVSGGDGSPITYLAVGVQRPSLTSATGQVESGLRADPKPLVIQATQRGVTVSQTFDFQAACGGQARMAVRSEPTSPLEVSVLGNPSVGGEVMLRVRGASGANLSVQTVDAGGRLQAEQQIAQPEADQLISVSLGNTVGLYLVRIQSGDRQQTVRVIRTQ